MRISKRLDGRQWQKTLAVTGLVTGSLVLGTLGNVSAHADDAPSQRTTDATTKAVNGPTVDQTTRQVTLKSGTPAPVTSDESKTSMPANNDKKTVTPVVSPKTPVNKPDQPAVPESTQAVKQPVTAVHTPVTPAVPANATPTPENEQPVQPAQMPAVASTATTKTPATTQAIDEWMPDKNLQKIVLRALQVQQTKDKETPITSVSEITPENLATLKRIVPADGLNGSHSYYDVVTKISNLQGLEKASALTNLRISTDSSAPILGEPWTRGALKDLSPIAGLKNLTEVAFAENSISDLSPLAGLTNLSDITLNYNLITDISALKGKSKVTWLDLDDNQVKDISVIKDMPKLKVLYLENNQVSDIAPLKVATKLNTLHLYGNHIRDIQPAYQNGKLPWNDFDASDQTVYEEPVTLEPGTTSYTFKNPGTLFTNGGRALAVAARPELSTPKTGLTVTPDKVSNTYTWAGLSQTQPNDLVMIWGDGQYFNGQMHVKVTVKQPTPVKPDGGSQTTTPTKPTTPTTPVTVAAATPDTTAPTTPVVATPAAPTVIQTAMSAHAAFKPFMIYTKDALNRYTQATFKENKIKKSYRKYTRQTAPTFKVVGVKKSVNGHLRYLLSNGTYVTARKDFVANLYWQGKHYTKIRVDRTIYEHQTTKFTKKNRVRVFKQGKVVTVKRIIHRGYMTRYQLTNGHWITGNKQFITPIKKA